MPTPPAWNDPEYRARLNRYAERHDMPVQEDDCKLNLPCHPHDDTSRCVSQAQSEER